MVVGTAADDGEAALHELLGQHLGVLLHLLGPLLELGLECLAESHGLGSDDVLQRSALLSGEHG